MNVKKNLNLDSLEKINIKEGTLYVPSNWICLNPEKAKICEYVGVIECRNHVKYDIPHFYFHTNERFPRNYDTDYLLNLVSIKWPEFKEKVLDQQIELKWKDDEEHSMRNCLNSEEHLASPYIGFFEIKKFNNKNYDNSQPYDARIEC